MNLAPELEEIGHCRRAENRERDNVRCTWLIKKFLRLLFQAEFSTSKRYLSQAVECLAQCVQLGLKQSYRVSILFSIMVLSN